MLAFTPITATARGARVDANTTVCVHAYPNDSIVSAWWTWRGLERQAHRFATDIDAALAEVIAEVHAPLAPWEVEHIRRADARRAKAQAAQRSPQ